MNRTADNYSEIAAYNHPHLNSASLSNYNAKARRLNYLKPLLDNALKQQVENSKNRLIVASLGEMSKPGAGIEVVDLKNKSISSLGKERSTSPFGGLDGIESDATETHYYVTDNPAGRLYDVNANGSEYSTLIELGTQGTADLGFIPSQSIMIIPVMQDNKLVAYKLVQ